MNRIAWARENSSNYSDLGWDGKALRRKGWMPVDTHRAIGSVTLYAVNIEAGLIVLGSNVEYMEYIEEGVRDTNYPTFAPFRRGVAYAFVHDILPQIDNFIMEEVDDGIKIFLDKL